MEEEPPAKLLDDLFRKTNALPCIYWLPLTDEQVCMAQSLMVHVSGMLAFDCSSVCSMTEFVQLSASYNNNNNNSTRLAALCSGLSG